MPFREKLKAALHRDHHHNDQTTDGSASPPIPPPKHYEDLPPAPAPHVVERLPPSGDSRYAIESHPSSSSTRRSLSGTFNRGPATYTPTKPAGNHSGRPLSTNLESQMSNFNVGHPPSASAARVSRDHPPSASAKRHSGDYGPRIDRGSRRNSLSNVIKKRLSGSLTKDGVVAAPIQTQAQPHVYPQQNELYSSGLLKGQSNITAPVRASAGFPLHHAARSHTLPPSHQFPVDPVTGGLDYSTLDSQTSQLAASDRLANPDSSTTSFGYTSPPMGSSVMDRGRPVGSYDGEMHRKPPSAAAGHLTGFSTGTGIASRPRRSSSLRRKPVGSGVDPIRSSRGSLKSPPSPSSSSIQPLNHHRQSASLDSSTLPYQSAQNPSYNPNIPQPTNRDFSNYQPTYPSPDASVRDKELADYKAKFEAMRRDALFHSNYMVDRNEGPVDATGAPREFDAHHNTQDVQRTIIYAPPVVHETVHNHVTHEMKEVINREVHLYDNLVRKQPVLVRNDQEAQELLREPVKVHVLH